jgi:ABC-type polysaccharide/polyol phosphate transport system ATPase subunit
LPSGSIRVDGVGKRFRLYHERPRSLKEVIALRRRRTFDEFWALRDVSFRVEPGETIGVVGANGSGKSTLLKCLARILTPDEGSIVAEGRVCALLELGAGFHPELTGRENVFLNGSILGVTRRELTARFDEIVALAGLERFIDLPVKNYSSGMYIRLGFAVAVNVRPDILLVDEVLAVGDADFQRKSVAKFKEMRARGSSVVIVTHALDAVRWMCDRAVLLRDGHVVEVGEAGRVVDLYRASGTAALETPSFRADGGRSDAVEIKQVDFRGTAGSPDTPVVAGRAMEARIDWRARVPVDEPTFRLDIFAKGSGMQVAEASSGEPGALVARLEGEGATQLTVAEVLLAPGEYLARVAVLDAGGVRGGDGDGRTFPFTVQPGAGPRQQGLVRLPARWEITSSARR